MPLRTALAIALFLIVFTPVPSSATVIVLDFEGLQESEQVLDFYNGGFGGSGSGPGPGFGITFGADSRARVDQDAGGAGNFANEPSPDTIVFFPTGSSVVMNVLDGFTTGFSFFYTSSFEGFVTVHEGFDGTGAVLATVPILAQYQSCGAAGDPNGDYRCWDPVGVSFPGTAHSVSFGGAAGFTGFDNITLGSSTPGQAPEPSLLALAAIALGALLYRRSD
jgi:hypothetical protein